MSGRLRRWRQACQEGGLAGLASREQAARCRLDEEQLGALDVVLDAGPLAAGWQDQRWTLARVRDLVAGKFRVQSPSGIWYVVVVSLGGQSPGSRAARPAP